MVKVDESISNWLLQKARNKTKIWEKNEIGRCAGLIPSSRKLLATLVDPLSSIYLEGKCNGNLSNCKFYKAKKDEDDDKFHIPKSFKKCGNLEGETPPQEFISYVLDDIKFVKEVFLMYFRACKPFDDNENIENIYLVDLFVKMCDKATQSMTIPSAMFFAKLVLTNPILFSDDANHTFAKKVFFYREMNPRFDGMIGKYAKTTKYKDFDSIITKNEKALFPLSRIRAARNPGATIYVESFYRAIQLYQDDLKHSHSYHHDVYRKADETAETRHNRCWMGLGEAHVALWYFLALVVDDEELATENQDAGRTHYSKDTYINAMLMEDPSLCKKH